MSWRGPAWRPARAASLASKARGRLFSLIECYQGVAARKISASILSRPRAAEGGAAPFARAARRQQATTGTPGPSLSRLYSA